MTTRELRGRERGQVLVIFAVALVALLAATGLVIDGGNAWSQQRIAQNSLDAAAEAGSVVLAQYYGGATSPSTTYTGTCPTSTSDAWDLAVCQSVYGAGSTNGVAVTTAYYTNPDGSANLGTVGQGSVPTGAQGVRVAGTKQFSTYLIGVVGISSMTAGGGATAVVGVVNAFCPPDTVCGTIPVAVPVQTALDCDVTGSLVIGQGDWPITSNFVPATESIIPLCKTGAGSVGWLQWPCESQPGTPGLLEEITTPCLQNLTLPQWISTSTGNPNAASIESALNAYHMKVVYVPQYDNIKGVGSNLQYHITQLHAFMVDYAYTAGNDTNHGGACNTPPGAPYVEGNGSSGCIKGWWTNTILTGSISLGGITPGTNQPLGVQLIK